MCCRNLSSENLITKWLFESWNFVILLRWTCMIHLHLKPKKSINKMRAGLSEKIAHSFSPLLYLPLNNPEVRCCWNLTLKQSCLSTYHLRLLQLGHVRSKHSTKLDHCSTPFSSPVQHENENDTCIMNFHSIGSKDLLNSGSQDQGKSHREGIKLLRHSAGCTDVD